MRKAQTHDSDHPLTVRVAVRSPVAISMSKRTGPAPSASIDTIPASPRGPWAISVQRSLVEGTDPAWSAMCGRLLIDRGAVPSTTQTAREPAVETR